MSTALMFLFPAVIVVMLAMPMIPVYRGVTTGTKAKRNIICNLCAFFGLCLVMILLPVGDFVAYAAGEAAAAGGLTTGSGLGYIGAALSTGLSCVGSGIAVAAAAPAAIGATSEDPKSFGKSLIFVVLGEGIALYGMLISIMIINSL